LEKKFTFHCALSLNAISSAIFGSTLSDCLFSMFLLLLMVKVWLVGLILKVTLQQSPYSLRLMKLNWL
jgi:hypothetical protein